MIRVLYGVLLSAAAMFAWAWYCWNPLLHVVQNKGILQPIAHVAPAQPEFEAGEAGLAARVKAGISLVKAGPAVVNPRDSMASVPAWAQRGVEFGQFLVVALVAAGLLKMACIGSYVGRAFFVLLLGVFASLMIDPAAVVRMHESWELPAYSAVFHLGCALIMALVLAAFVRPQSAALRVPRNIR
jgi:hypothetical protein